MKNRLFKKIGFGILLLLCSAKLMAQGSYIYLEGIKSFPFSILLNDKEYKPTAKNFILLSPSQNGENTVEIVFAGNIFPKQKFIINVSENSSYGYKLSKTNEDKFYLLDLVNSGKIIELNTDINIALSTPENNIHFNTLKTKTTEVITVSKKEKRKKKSTEEKIEENTVLVENKATIDTPKYGVIEEISANKDSLENVAIEIPSKKIKKEKKKKNTTEIDENLIEKSKKVEEKIERIKNEDVAENNISEKVEKKKKRKKSEEKIEQNTVVIENKESEIPKVEIPQIPEEKPKAVVKINKCLRAASDNEVNVFAEKLLAKQDDEAKLLLVKKKYFTGCLTTKQLYTIIETFDTQYNRFSVVKFVKPDIQDAENLGELDELFKYESYKSKLKKLLSE